MTFEDGTVGDDTKARDQAISLTLGRGELFPKLEVGLPPQPRLRLVDTVL